MLISPISFRDADWATNRFNVSLTKEKVKNSPGADTDKPVSRQFERSYYGYYGYPYYWAGSGLWGEDAYPASLAAATWTDRAWHVDERAADVHLRSAKEVTGYHVRGNDGAIGHVSDFIVDDETMPGSARKVILVASRSPTPSRHACEDVNSDKVSGKEQQAGKSALRGISPPPGRGRRRQVVLGRPLVLGPTLIPVLVLGAASVASFKMFELELSFLL